MFSSQVCSTDLFGNTSCYKEPGPSFYSPYSTYGPHYTSPIGGTTVTTTQVIPSPGWTFFGWNWYSFTFSIIFLIIIVVIVIVAVVFGKSSSSSVLPVDLSTLNVYPEEINKFTLTDTSSGFSPDLIETNFANPLNGGSKIQMHLSNRPPGPANINKITFRWVKRSNSDPLVGETGIRQVLYCDYNLGGYLAKHPDGYLYLSPVIPEERRAIKLARVNNQFTLIDSDRTILRYRSYPGMIYAGNYDMKTIGFGGSNSPILFNLDNY